MDYDEQWNSNRVNWLYQLARSPDLGAGAVRVGLLFATFLQPTRREEVRPGHDWLMEHAQMSRATLQKALKELETAGFLTVDRWHRYRSAYGMPFTGDAPWVPKSLSSKSEPQDIRSLSLSSLERDKDHISTEFKN